MKKCSCLLMLAVLIIAFSFSVKAEDLPDEETVWNQSGFSELYEQLDSPVKDILNRWGIGNSVNAGEGFSPQNLFSDLIRRITELWKIPLSVLGAGMTVLLIGSLMIRFSDERGMNRAATYLVGICMSGVVLIPASGTLEKTVQAITASGEFLLAYLPLYSGLLLLMGRRIVATADCGFVYTFAQAMIWVCGRILSPMAGVLFAMAAASSFGEESPLHGIIDGIRRVLTWTMGILTTLFSGIVSITGFVSGSGDSVRLRTSRYLVGNLVPVVGSALSESLAALQGCLVLLKNGAGILGLCVILAFLLPILLELLLWRLTLLLLSLSCEVLGMSILGKTLNAFTAGIRVLISLVICCLAAATVGLTVIMLCGGGG